MTDGERIKELRAARKLSQRALAKMAGVSFSYIARLELGHYHSPSVEIARKIAKALGTTDRKLFPERAA